MLAEKKGDRYKSTTDQEYQDIINATTILAE